MQCILKKRSLEPEGDPWRCRAKRMCLEAELVSAECPMETSFSLIVSKQQAEQQMEVSVLQPRPSVLCCPRCLGGEPGHINHIMGH